MLEKTTGFFTRPFKKVYEISVGKIKQALSGCIFANKKGKSRFPLEENKGKSRFPLEENERSSKYTKKWILPDGMDEHDLWSFCQNFKTLDTNMVDEKKSLKQEIDKVIAILIANNPELASINLDTAPIAFLEGIASRFGFDEIKFFIEDCDCGWGLLKGNKKVENLIDQELKSLPIEKIRFSIEEYMKKKTFIFPIEESIVTLYGESEDKVSFLKDNPIYLYYTLFGILLLKGVVPGCVLHPKTLKKFIIQEFPEIEK